MDALLEKDARKFYRSFSELLRVYQFRDRTRICYHDISVTQCHALSVLLRSGPISQKKLSLELCLDKSTTSRVVDSLERKKYVKRSPDPEDGRAILLEVTTSGRALHRRIEEELIAEYGSLLVDLKPDVRRGVIEVMSRLSRIAGEKFRNPGSDMPACDPVKKSE